jgi:hypothetical protein
VNYPCSEKNFTYLTLSPAASTRSAKAAQPMRERGSTNPNRIRPLSFEERRSRGEVNVNESTIFMDKLLHPYFLRIIFIEYKNLMPDAPKSYLRINFSYRFIYIKNIFFSLPGGNKMHEITEKKSFLTCNYGILKIYY